MLIKVPHRPSPRQPRHRRIRGPQRHMMLAVEKVGRVPRKVCRREQTRVVAQQGRRPFPDAAVGPFAMTLV